MANQPFDEDAIAERFHGTWRLISVVRADPETGANLDEGVACDGVIAYTDDRRVTVIIARTAPGNPRFITSYAARWTLEPDYVTHHVDLGTEEKREGTAQVRRYDFNGDILTLTPPSRKISPAQRRSAASSGNASASPPELEVFPTRRVI